MVAEFSIVPRSVKFVRYATEVISIAEESVGSPSRSDICAPKAGVKRSKYEKLYDRKTNPLVRTIITKILLLFRYSNRIRRRVFFFTERVPMELLYYNIDTLTETRALTP